MDNPTYNCHPELVSGSREKDTKIKDLLLDNPTYNCHPELVSGSQEKDTKILRH